MNRLMPALMVAVAVAPALAHAAPVQWTLASGGNGHYYDIVDATVDYATAMNAAAASTFMGDVGNLLVLEPADYTPELNFVFANVVGPHALPFLNVYWVGATQQVVPDHALDRDWVWLDGEPVPTATVDTWVVDHNEGNTPGFFYGAGFYGNGDVLGDYRVDNPSGLAHGYVVEYAAAVPEARMLIPALAGLMALRRR